MTKSDKTAKSSRKSTHASVLGMQVTTSTHDLLRRLADHGLVEGKPGKQQLGKEAQELLDALLHVLAGGSVKVEITTPGEASTVKELRGLVDEAASHANAINKGLGHSVVAFP